MASDMELNLDIQAAENLRFVDHVECKIVSPGKEIISPIKDKSKGSFPSSPVSDEIDSPEKESEKSSQNNSKNSDSGLDSSNNSSDYGNEHYVDRQEKYTDNGELEKIVSPTKSGSGLFPSSSSGNASSQSLDAINNNEEVETSENDVNSNVRTETVRKDIYLGKEVCLHETDVGKSQTQTQTLTKERHVSETSMNLYWYGSSLNVDLEEIEAFKDSQNEPVTSSVQINVSDYYQNKSAKLNADNSSYVESYKSETKFDVKQSPIVRDSWSPAFESASSRILDLASSELKTEPKNKKNKANESIRDLAGADTEKHPWGLDSESRVITDTVIENTDDLPELGAYTSTDAGENVKQEKNVVLSQERISDQQMDSNATSTLEWSSGNVSRDAVGYMELKDKPSTPAKSSNIRGEDVADAVGYMEIKDKPSTPVKSTEAKSDAKTKQEAATKKKQGAGEDTTDSVGYMELKGLNTEQMIVAADQKVLETSQAKMTKQTEALEQIQSAKSSNLESQIMKIKELSQTDDSKTTSAKTQSAPKVKFEPFTMKRTYLIDEKSENTVQEMGGLYIDTETMVDEYLDDKNYALTLKDCWLRLRNKKFEMKINSAFGYDPNRPVKGEMINNENEIIEVLHKLYKKKLEQKRRVSERQLDVLIDELKITEFVTFETTRKRYQVDEFIVTLDLTNFGFQVGEIEVLANTAREMSEGLRKMDSLASKLGLRPLQSN